MLSEKQKTQASLEEDLITVIIPVYNVKQELPVCMESVLRQTYKNLEIILINDGSTDGSGALCDNYCNMDKRCRVFHKEHGEVSDARNYGLAKISGKYITFVDSDDLIDEDYVEYLYLLIQNSGLNMAICQHRVKFVNGSMIEYGREGKEILSNKICIERMLYHDVIDTSAWGKLYDRRLFENIQYPEGKLYEDMGTTYKLFLRCEHIAVGYESKYTYIRRRGSIVNGPFNRKKLDLLEMTDRMGKDVIQYFPDLQAAVLCRRVYARISTLNQILDVKEVEKERRDILSFIKKEKYTVLRDANAPKRDKAALLLIGINYRLYRAIWRCYQKYLWRGGKSTDVG